MKKMKFFAAAICMFLSLSISQNVHAAPKEVCKYSDSIGRVSGLKATVCTTKSINIRWNPVKGASGYEIYRSVARNGNYTLLYDMSSGNCAFMNITVQSGKEYYYKVRAYTGRGKDKHYGKYSKLLRANTKPLSSRKLTAKCNINVRKYAGTNYARICGALKGTKLKFLCEACDQAGTKWYRVQLKMNNKKYTGYIRSDLAS